MPRGTQKPWIEGYTLNDIGIPTMGGLGSLMSATVSIVVVNYLKAPARALIWDPCRCGQPRILTVAYIDPKIVRLLSVYEHPRNGPPNVQKQLITIPS